MIIRAATLGDVPEIAEIHVSTWQVAYRGQVPNSLLDGLSVDRRAAAWTDIVESSAWPSTGVFVAEDDEGKLIGFTHICPSRDADARGDVGEVTSIYVAPDSWRCGAGQALLRHACTSLASANFTYATLWVLDTNERARQFYERLGWQADGRVKVDDRGSFALTELRYAIPLP